MTNNWIEFVKQFAIENNISYKEALKEAKKYYKKEPERILQAVSNKTYWMFGKKYKIKNYRDMPILKLRELIEKYEIDNGIKGGLYQ